MVVLFLHTEGSLRLWVDGDSAEKVDFMKIRSGDYSLEELSSRLKQKVSSVEKMLV